VTIWLEPFESIGENCEFGFVQRALGHEVGSLLRWAFLDSTASTVAGISTGFANVFAFENLVPAAEGAMVRDKVHGVAFHTAMRAERTSSGWAFLANEQERRAIHATESQKIDYLREKFERAIVGENRIYVAKRGSGLTVADAEELYKSISARGGGSLLFVTPACGNERPGTARLVHDRIAHGIVERFAPHTQADDIALASWRSVLQAALASFHLS
jgi:hypothetical protein